MKMLHGRAEKGDYWKKNTRHDKGAERGWIMGGRVENLFPTQKLDTHAGNSRGGNRDRKGEITGVENDVAAWAISHSESRPDTSASIIQITMANEQDPNKITLELTGSTMKHFYVQNVAPLCLFGFGFYWQQKKNWQLDTIFISLDL